MSTINEHNLDELLFDYLEGNLSQEKAAEVSDFLSRNPQYAAEVEAWQGTFVEAPAKAAPYAGATSLLRPVGAGIAGNGGWSASGLGIVGTVIAVASMVLFWQLSRPGEKDTPVQQEVVVQQEEVSQPEPTDPVATLPPAIEENTESVNIEPPVAARKLVQPAKFREKSPARSSAVVSSPDPEPVVEAPAEVTPELAPELLAPEPNLAIESPPIPEVQPLPPPEVVAPLPTDTAPPAVVQQRDYPELQGQQTKRGRKKRLRNKKPVRVVPLKSDAF